MPLIIDPDVRDACTIRPTLAGWTRNALARRALLAIASGGASHIAGPYFATVRKRDYEDVIVDPEIGYACPVRSGIASVALFARRARRTFRTFRPGNSFGPVCSRFATIAGIPFLASLSDARTSVRADRPGIAALASFTGLPPFAPLRRRPRLERRKPLYDAVQRPGDVISHYGRERLHQCLDVLGHAAS
jgi:hypothetical protein